MSDQMAKALQYKHDHPQAKYSEMPGRYGIPATTFRDRFLGIHADRATSATLALSVAMEAALVDKINDYASRGTLLSPKHVHELAEAISGKTLGANWASTFTRRHSHQITSRFWAYQELARLKADTPETRRAFYKLVSCPESDTVLTRY